MTNHCTSVSSHCAAKPDWAMVSKPSQVTQLAATAKVATVPTAAPIAQPAQVDYAAQRPRLSAVAEAVKTVAAETAGGVEASQSEAMRAASMDFARALMQALGAGTAGVRSDGEAAGNGQGKHLGHVKHGDHARRGHHHCGGGDEGYQAMQGLAQRIGALAQTYLAPAPQAAAIQATPAPAAPVAAPPSPATAPVVSPVAAPAAVPAIKLATALTSTAPAATAAAAPPATSVSSQAPAPTTVAAPPAPIGPISVAMPSALKTASFFQERLLDAFEHMRSLLQGDADDVGEGDPTTATTPPTRDELRAELGAFLAQLSGALDDEEAMSLEAPTTPGALIDLAA